MNRSVTVLNFTCKSLESANQIISLCLGSFSSQRVLDIAQHGLRNESMELKEAVGRRTAVRMHHVASKRKLQGVRDIVMRCRYVAEFLEARCSLVLRTWILVFRFFLPVFHGGRGFWKEEDSSLCFTYPRAKTSLVQYR